jgi:hypothetical protein
MMEMTTMLSTTPGQFTVCLTKLPLQETAFELSNDLISEGEPLLVVDAAGCFDPGRMSQAAPDFARHLHILRVSDSGTLDEIWSGLLSAQQRYQARRALVVGLLDHLYDPRVRTRDAARALGKIKSQLGTLTENGLEVTVVCQNANPSPDTRAYFVPSLCASADQVRAYETRLSA